MHFFVQQSQPMCGVVILHKQRMALLGGKRDQPFGLSPKSRHSSLFVIHLEKPNVTPHALIGRFWGSTGVIPVVLTGPSRLQQGRSLQLLEHVLRQGSL